MPNTFTRELDRIIEEEEIKRQELALQARTELIKTLTTQESDKQSDILIQ